MSDLMRFIGPDIDPIAGSDDDTELFNEEEWDEIIKSLGQPTIAFPSWAQPARVCDCGAKVAKTTHSDWCSMRKL